MKKVFESIYDSIYDFIDEIKFMFSVALTEMIFLSIGTVFVIGFLIVILINIFNYIFN